VFYDTGDLRDGEIVLQLKETREAQPEKRWLPAYYFDICLPDGAKAGNCSLRVGHNEKTRIGGNIGYGVYPAYRGHHYAAKACVLLFRPFPAGIPLMVICSYFMGVPSFLSLACFRARLIRCASFVSDIIVHQNGVHVNVKVHQFDVLYMHIGYNVNAKKGPHLRPFRRMMFQDAWCSG
jgi:hypothetical protein